jgi:DNA-binding transcriptional ArsR family regulator
MVLPGVRGYPVAMADIFDVVADPTRRTLLQVLLERYVSPEFESGEISVGDIVERLGLSQPTVSKHLKVLRDHGMVTVREVGQHRYYRLDTAPLEELEDWLIPFLSADYDGTDYDERGVSAFAAWSGADVGATIGRRVAESTYGARTAIEDVSHRVADRLPEPVRRRIFPRS